MKLGIISTMHSVPWGGSEELWAAMTEEALRQGIEVAVSVYGWPSSPAKVQALRVLGAKLFPRPLHSTPGRMERLARRAGRFVPGLSKPKAGTSFRDFFEARPDVLCISQGGTYDSVFTDGLLDSLYAASIPWVVVCQFNADSFVPDEATRKRAAEFFARAQAVVFVAERNRKTAERQLAVALPNARVLQNPVNLPDTAAVAWPASATSLLACVARLEVAYKGQDLLIEALAGPESKARDWKLRLYGEGPDRAYLEALATRFGIENRVEFRGHVADVKGIWAENHLLVLPSRAEGTPLSMVEAMLCGRPVVVTDVGGNSEWVAESENGFVAEAPSADSLSAALQSAWQAKPRWEQIGATAHERTVLKLDKSPGKTLLGVVLQAAKAGHVD
jgi:glycosyltransferase involved in cell wall biosynthesis